MFDTPLRRLKDTLISPLASPIPPAITPTHITLLAFLVGLAACHAAATDPQTFIPATLFLLNRLLDSLDGALARSRAQQTELGAFLDLVGDFAVYALIPICVAAGSPLAWGAGTGTWPAVAALEASFFLNNFVLFYGAAVVEKVKAAENSAAWEGERKKKEGSCLTSLAMKPALIEGFESGVLFTLMLAFPGYLEPLAWGMGFCVCIGTVQRVLWLGRLLAVLDGDVSAVKG